ncbi:MAG TPA: superoxide dismutase family protein [Terriglobia bacterium]|jgi:Cu-Zn family superoxide dismutase|nr:superoxide dismutase family protein [Terriglobia bacterium]
MKYATLLSVLILASCTLMAAEKSPKSAKAELRNAEGQPVGTATLKPAATGVRINLRVFNLPPGTHAFHIHAVGKCDPPDFKTAGGHFNPENKKHGLKNPEGPHAGDMPNITVNKQGKGSATVVNPRVTLGEGANSLFHEGGTALVIHEKADDDMTDPAGNAGNRIACGVIEAGK